MSKIFREIQQGNTLYVLVKGDSKITYEESSVISVSAPRAEIPQAGQFQPTFRQVVDLTYTVAGKTYTDAVDVTQSVLSTGRPGSPTLVATEKEFVLNELKETLKQTDKVLKDFDKLKKRSKDCKALISELDTEFREKELTENRLTKLEESTSKTNDLLQQLLKKIEEKKLF